jgi:hypothetical protein
MTALYKKKWPMATLNDLKNVANPVSHSKADY